MERNEQIFDRIESYLLGEMTPEEKQGFEREMSGDEELRELVDKQRLEWDAIEVLMENDLRSQMQAWQTEETPIVEKKQTTGGRIRPLYWVVVGLAAVVLALIIFRGLLQPEVPGQEVVQQDEEPVPGVIAPPVANAEESPRTTPPAETPERRPTPPRNEPAPPVANYLAIAAETYELPPDLRGDLRSVETAEESPLDAGLAAFEAKSYPEAIQAFSALGPEIGEDAYARAREILGHAYFLNRQYREAARVFEILANDPEFEFVRQYGEWYLTLSLLPEYPRNKARVDALLAKMTDPAKAHNYRAAARELQGRLEK